METIPKDILGEPTYNMQQKEDNEHQHENNRTNENNGDIDVEMEQPKQPEVRAKSARELVKSQEHLLDLLQSMRSDLAKMDREASAIKEDIVRSNQMFHVMVKMETTHNLQYLPGGYNISHALPKVTYQRHRNTEKELNIKYLSQLSTYKPRFLSSSRSVSRSSLSSTGYRDYEGGYRSVTPSSGIYASRQSSIGNILSNSSADDSYSGNSGTESEIDSATPRTISRTRTSYLSSEDSSSTCDEAGSSTESVSTQGRYQVNQYQRAGRRPSYFYTVRVETPPQVQSDEIDL